MNRDVTIQHQSRIFAFFTDPPLNFDLYRGNGVREQILSYTRRRPDVRRVIWCIPLFYETSVKNVLGGQSQKFHFCGENPFFSPPSVTPLGSVWPLSFCTRRDLPGKENRKSIGP